MLAFQPAGGTVAKVSTLELKGITKRFSTLLANENVDLSVYSGEVVGILGENGAGKTTLMNILFGLYRPDQGQIKIDGKETHFRTPRDAIRAGIGMVHQHFMLVQNHSVAENIALGWTDAPLFFPQKFVKKRIAELSRSLGFSMDPDQKIWELSAGEQQRVEIVKTLIYGAEILILDEPTSVLTPVEAKELFSIVRKMSEEGKIVLLISHKLDEILEHCHRVAILRKGKLVAESTATGLTRKELARLMVGQDVEFVTQRNPQNPGEVVLEVSKLRVVGDRETEVVRGVSFDVRKNEIFGIAGVSGNGQRELVEAVTGLRHAHSGGVFVQGKEITNESAKVIASLGLSHIPEERIKFGIVPNLLIYENAVLKSHHGKPFTDVIFMDYSLIRDHAENIVDQFKINTSSIEQPLKNLSGGNIQKLILGREILSNPTLLVASHPTYGLDVGASHYIREQLLKRRDDGGAVLLVSEDLEEVVQISDRVAVMFRGQIVAIVDPRSTSLEEIGLMMAGIIPDGGKE